MRLTIKQVGQAAAMAAQTVYTVLEPRPAGKWWVLCGAPTVEPLVAFVAASPEAPAEAVYRYAMADTYAQRPWGVDPALTAAVVSFHGVLLQLVPMVVLDDVPAMAHGGRFGPSTYRRKAGPRQRLDAGGRRIAPIAADNDPAPCPVTVPDVTPASSAPKKAPR